MNKKNSYPPRKSQFPNAPTPFHKGVKSDFIKSEDQKSILSESPVPTENSGFFKIGQEVSIRILRETRLGFVAEIELDSQNEDSTSAKEGLLYHSEIFEKISEGQRLSAFIKHFREDGKIDLILQAFGNKGAPEIAQRILDSLDYAHGFLPITDHSEAQIIYDNFGVSKKKFKIALGLLYKQRIIDIKKDGIYKISDSPLKKENNFSPKKNPIKKTI